MKKKVLFVINHFRYSNGVASALFNIIANLDISKYEIYLLAIYEFDEEFAAPIRDRITVIKGFNRYFRGLDQLLKIVPGKLLYRFFVRETFDLEIAFQFGCPTRMVAMGNNSNRICWMHGYDEKMVMRKYYERYRKIITVSNIGRERLLHDGFKKEKTDFCYNIIDENRIIDLAEESIDIKLNDRFIIVTVGRLSPEKGFMRYLKCIKASSSVNNDIEYWIIGDGIEYQKMEQFIHDNNLGETVKLFGLKKNPFMYMYHADLYFCVSFHEGFSTTCQEAALLGIPVISVDVDGAQELVEIAGCGEVIPNDQKAIEKKLKELVQNREIVEEWKQKANATKECFFKHKRIQKIEDVLDSFLY